MNDQECLRAFGRQPSAESFRPLVERYLAFVYSAAYRRTGDEARAGEVPRAVVLGFAYKARWLPRKTVLAGWLFRATRFATLKLIGKPKRPGVLRSIWRILKQRLPGRSREVSGVR